MRTHVLLATVLLGTSVAGAADKPKVVPNINESTEFPSVYHSPSADSTPPMFRSIFQMEIVVKRGDREPQVVYANGVVVSRDGLIVSVMDAPKSTTESNGGITSASILTLDGGGAAAELVRYDAVYGVAVFKVKGLDAPALRLSQSPLVANRRTTWCAVFRDGRKTFLYRRPLQVHTAAHAVGDTSDLCEFIDHGSSSLNADRSGSALIALDGTVLALMGRMPHWNVSPKNVKPRTKVAWAVPAAVIARLIDQDET